MIACAIFFPFVGLLCARLIGGSQAKTYHNHHSPPIIPRFTCCIRAGRLPRKEQSNPIAWKIHNEATAPWQPESHFMAERTVKSLHGWNDNKDGIPCKTAMLS
jgi:hypothetical protein